MKKRKILCLLLALAMVMSLALTACSGGQATTGVTTTQKPVEPGPSSSSAVTHTHAFGDWTADKIPTVEEQGTAKRSCSCGETETKVLPALTDSGYVVTENTATTSAPGTGKYTITLEDVTVSFTAPTEQLVPEYEDVVTEADFMTAITMAGGEKQKPTEDLIVGKFTFCAGCYFESSNTKYFDNGNVNTQKKDILFTLSGSVNSIRFDARGASSGGCVIIVWQIPEAGEPVEVYRSEELASGDLIEGVEIKDLAPGDYRIETTGSARIGDFFVTEKMEKSNAVSIEARPADSKFLLGREITTDGIIVELVYANGRRDTVTASEYSTDLSSLDLKTSGKKTVTVTHTATGFTAQYEIVLYQVESVELSDFSLDSDRVTHPVQKIYIQGGSYDNYANIAVIATCSAQGIEETEIFVLKEGEYTFSPAAVENPYISVKVNLDRLVPPGGTGREILPVQIIEVSDKFNKTHIIVDANGTVGEGGDGVITVRNVNDAVKLFELLGTPDDTRKTITICPGTYKEKVDISIPNLSILAKQGAKAEEIVITFDALNGLSDPSGTVGYSTDGSATFSLRAGAKGFIAKGFTIMNYYNNHERYEASKLIAGSGTQAVALLVRADQCVFENMRFSSYQDTLYAENGRQVYRNCYIEGRTDYIFGNNATCYFDGCTIRSIFGNDAKNGGYVITTKGGKESAHVEYGFIFNNCTFEGEEKVEPGSVSIARGWDKYMTIMVMNCKLDESFSLEAYGDTGSNKNDRYTKMNADPVAAQLFEYNNTGAGALTADIIATAKDGVIENLCSIPTAQRAADFADFSKIFAATNGSFKYSETWDGSNE